MLGQILSFLLYLQVSLGGGGEAHSKLPWKIVQFLKKIQNLKNSRVGEDVYVVVENVDLYNCSI